METRRTISIAILLAAGLLGAVSGSAAAADLSRLIAPPSACPGQSDLGAPAARQEQAMRCMANYARRRSGLGSLRRSAQLDRSAGRKSGDMIRCDEFSHEACGREFTYWIERVGFIHGGCWRASENIAWGSGRLGSVRSIFSAWIHSRGHRENILGPFGWIGVGLRQGSLDGLSGAHVWTQHFGARC